MKKIVVCICTVIASLLLLAGCNKNYENNEKPVASAETVATTIAEAERESFDISVAGFNKYGNAILDTTFDYLNDRDIELGDIITVTINDQKYDMPVGTSYSDVDSGNMICRFDYEDQKVLLAVNGDSLAETTNMAEKQIADDNSTITWNIKVDKVSLCLKEKKGYLDEYTIRSLERSNERSEYANLSDDDFANCRVVSVTGIKPNTLFRGTTPIDPKIGRNEYAMKFIEANKIRTILNLCNTYEEMTAFADYPDSYYSTCAILDTVMVCNFATDDYASKVKECVLFINENDGPFYIHCKEGKDRTGILCAVLECYFGASYDEINNDYIKSFENFYHVEEGSDIYNLIIKTNFEKTLSEMFGIKDPGNANLRKEAEEYLLSCGLTESDLSSLAAKIGE